MRCTNIITLQVMRTQLPTLELDAVFEAKEDLAIAVKNALTEIMTSYGYQIVQVLITDLDPDERVKNAMNEINSSKRLKYAVAERAEGAKILQVKAAEAEAEAKYLSGVGVAKQRKAIVDGLRNSIVDFSDNVSGSSTKEVMDLLLLTQYFDMIRDVGSSGNCYTTFVPSPRGPGDEMRNALLQANRVNADTSVRFGATAKGSAAAQHQNHNNTVSMSQALLRGSPI